MTTRKNDEEPNQELQTQEPAFPQRFPHHKLDVYWLSKELAHDAQVLAAAVPRGYGKVADNLRRSGAGIPLLIAEAANRRSRAQKRQRFEEALGETGECAAALELVFDWELADIDRAACALNKADRVAAMLFKLELKHR